MNGWVSFSKKEDITHLVHVHKVEATGGRVDHLLTHVSNSDNCFSMNKFVQCDLQSGDNWADVACAPYYCMRLDTEEWLHNRNHVHRIGTNQSGCKNRRFWHSSRAHIGQCVCISFRYPIRIYNANVPCNPLLQCLGDGADHPNNAEVRRLIQRKADKGVRTLALESDCYWHSFFRIDLSQQYVHPSKRVCIRTSAPKHVPNRASKPNNHLPHPHIGILLQWPTEGRRSGGSRSNTTRKFSPLRISFCNLTGLVSAFMLTRWPNDVTLPQISQVESKHQILAVHWRRSESPETWNRWVGGYLLNGWPVAEWMAICWLGGHLPDR